MQSDQCQTIRFVFSPTALSIWFTIWVCYDERLTIYNIWFNNFLGLRTNTHSLMEPIRTTILVDFVSFFHREHISRNSNIHIVKFVMLCSTYSSFTISIQTARTIYLWVRSVFRETRRIAFKFIQQLRRIVNHKMCAAAAFQSRTKLLYTTSVLLCRYTLSAHRQTHDIAIFQPHSRAELHQKCRTWFEGSANSETEHYRQSNHRCESTCERCASLALCILHCVCTLIYVFNNEWVLGILCTPEAHTKHNQTPLGLCEGRVGRNTVENGIFGTKYNKCANKTLSKILFWKYWIVI